MPPRHAGSIILEESEDEADLDDSADEDEEDEDEEEEDEEDSGGEDTAEKAKVLTAVQALDCCLKHPLRTRWKVSRCFRAHATRNAATAARSLSLAQAHEMGTTLAAKLQLPAWLFQDFSQLFERFDFDGDGQMNREECTKMIRKALQQRRTELGGHKQPMAVRESTLEAAGYSVIKELGRGGQGVMYLCASSRRWSAPVTCGESCQGTPSNASDRRYCIKFYDKENANACDLDELIGEYALMKGLTSEYVARTYEVFQDRAFYYLVNEPYYGGDFTKLGKRANEKGVAMNERWWRGIFRQCLLGLAYLHMNAVIHCDIKEPNIMIAAHDSYRAPRPVLIDFGLSTAFGKIEHERAAGEEVGSPGGTPGYVPPETWETEVWYPAGDIFSLGVVFLQLMVARVPGVGGTVLGVLQKGDGSRAFARAARERPFPWDKFPDMPDLRELIDQMTNPDRRKRLRASQALAHRWFSSKANAKLPPATIRGLVCTSEGHTTKEKVMEQLRIMNNLDEIRSLQENLHEAAATPKRRAIPSARAAALLKKHGVEATLAEEFVEACTGADGYCRLATAVDETLAAKEQYAQQLIKDLFDDLDADKSGSLSATELRALLDTSAFECPYHDIQDVMNQMDADRDGMVSFKEFNKVVLNDGRIARRSEVDAEKRSVCSTM